jgi:hypothetical protein
MSAGPFSAQTILNSRNTRFSVDSALRVYGMYLELDSDQNGMLSQQELCKVSKSVIIYHKFTAILENLEQYDYVSNYDISSFPLTTPVKYL